MTVASSWRFIATRFDGRGGETIIHPDVPFTAATLTHALSAPDEIAATCSPQVPTLTAADGGPLLVPWQTGIWAECDGVIRGGGILTDLHAGEADLGVTVAGLTQYPSGQPWTGPRVALYDRDPGYLTSWLWRKIQAVPGADLGLRVDPITTPARVGIISAAAKAAKDAAAKAATPNLDAMLAAGGAAVTPAQAAKSPGSVAKTPGNATNADNGVLLGQAIYNQVAAGSAAQAGGASKSTAGDVDTTDEPWVLDVTETADLGAVFDGLVTAGQIETREETAWDGDTLTHRLLLAHPRLGIRHTGLRFAVGENVTVTPTLDIAASDYASDVIVLGAGESTRKVQARASTGNPDRLRRTVLHSDAGITRAADAQQTATRLLAALSSPADALSSVTVLNHAAAPFGAFAPGDEILVQGEAGWGGDLYSWVRILAVEYDPIAAPDSAVLDVVPVGRVAA